MNAKLLRTIKTRNCPECNGLMYIETATTDTGSSPDTHTQFETKYWECEKCGATEDFNP